MLAGMLASKRVVMVTRAHFETEPSTFHQPTPLGVDLGGTLDGWDCDGYLMFSDYLTPP